MFGRFRSWLAGKISPQPQSSQTGSWGNGRAFEIARYDPNHPYWYPTMKSGDAAIRDSWWLSTARVRDSYRHHPDLVKARRMIASLALGKGMVTHADAVDSNGEEIEDFNTETDYWFEAWSEYEADDKREDTLNFMFQRAFEDMITVGNAFLIETQNEDNQIVPLAYQLLEWEQVAREFDRPGDEYGNNRVHNGIRYDGQGRKSALLVYTDHPYSDLRAGYNVEEVPWSRVCHLYMPLQISADSGMTWFYPLLKNARNQQHYVECEMEAAKVASQLTICGKSNHYAPNDVPIGGRPTGGEIVQGADEIYGPDLMIGQPATAWVEAEGDVKVVESARPNKDAKAFLDTLDGRNARGVALSKQRLTGDAAGANFASIKAAHEDDKTVITPIQQHFIDHMLFKIRRRFTAMAVATRKVKSISTDQYRRQIFRFNRIDVTPPGTPTAEPVKEVEAAKAAIGAGMSNLKIECARRGLWWKDVLYQSSREVLMAEKLGLALDFSKGQGGQLAKSSNERMDPDELEESNGTQEGSTA